MSGHSKWSTIKHKKGAKDAKRGKLFGKLARGIEVAAREGGGDPSMNARLALAIQKAKDSSMPGDNIERAIKRGTGDVEGATYEEMWYEGYAPGGVAIYVQILTDNRNRAASDVRTAFTRNGGSLGEPGSVAYLFEQKGYLLVMGDEDEVLLTALEAGAEDVQSSGDQFEVTTAPGDFVGVREALTAAGITVEAAEVT
jgi:YebC/PmpR family DNA-binding regulatory protein